MGKTSIAWCDFTFNTWWGCTEVSPACDNCYARTLAHRLGHEIWGKAAPRRFFGTAHWREPLRWNKAAPGALERPRVFCGSMCDVLEDRTDLEASRVALWRLIEQTPNLDWLLLTKRPQNFRRMLPPPWLDEPRENVWLLTTVESPAYYWRLDELRNIPAVVRGVSIEPLLKLMPDLNQHLCGIHWPIIGGESGARAKPFSLEALDDIIAQAQDCGCKIFVKQYGARPTRNGQVIRLRDRAGADPDEWEPQHRIREFPR